MQSAHCPPVPFPPTGRAVASLFAHVLTAEHSVRGGRSPRVPTMPVTQGLSLQ